MKNGERFSLKSQMKSLNLALDLICIALGIIAARLIYLSQPF